MHGHKTSDYLAVDLSVAGFIERFDAGNTSRAMETMRRYPGDNSDPNCYIFVVPA